MQFVEHFTNFKIPNRFADGDELIPAIIISTREKNVMWWSYIERGTICYTMFGFALHPSIPGFNKTLAHLYTENIATILGGNWVWHNNVNTLELNHVRGSLKSLIAIHVIGFCSSHHTTEIQNPKSMKKQLLALLLNC